MVRHNGHFDFGRALLEMKLGVRVFKKKKWQPVAAFLYISMKFDEILAGEGGQNEDTNLFGSYLVSLMSGVWSCGHVLYWAMIKVAPHKPT